MTSLTKVNRFPDSLYNIALEKATNLLSQAFNNQCVTKNPFLNTLLPRQVAATLLQKISQDSTISIHSALVAQFIVFQSPNPLILSQSSFNVEEVVRQFLSKSAPLSITATEISQTNITPEIARFFTEKCPCLQIFKISQCSFPSNGLAVLLNGLNPQQLGQLELSYVVLSSDDVKLLAEYLKNATPSLQRLTLENLLFEDESNKDILTQKLLLSLIEHPSLLSLQYQNNGLGSKSITAMKGVIESCPALKEVKFTFDLFSDPGSQELLPALEKKSQFILDLSENYLNAASSLQFLKTGKAIIQHTA